MKTCKTCGKKIIEEWIYFHDFIKGKWIVNTSKKYKTMRHEKPSNHIPIPENKKC